MTTFDGKVILITGGTGSFGQRFATYLVSSTKARKVIVFSRDEMKQWKMAQAFDGVDNIRFFIGDVRDKERLLRAFKDVDYVVHAAATKIVTTAEYNPFECVKTNVEGAMHVIDAAIDRGVQKVVALSTDKASSPINLYGATKLASDKLFIAGNAYSGEHDTKFGIVRYGNVMGSRGSVIPFFCNLDESAPMPITHKDMTRFLITLPQAINLVEKTFDLMIGGEIFVPRIPSMKVTDIARAVNPKAEFDFIGTRPGEKLHEQMIGSEDAQYTYMYEGYFKVLPSINGWNKNPDRIKGGKPVPFEFQYDSASNPDWMSIDTLREWIKQNRSSMLEI